MFQNVADYFAAEFPGLNDENLAWTSLSDGYKKHGKRVIKIFDRFMGARFENATDITIDHLVAFMSYRVTGERSGADFHAGSISLAAFKSIDIGPLMAILRFQGRTDLKAEDVRRSEWYQAAVRTIRKDQNERGCHSPARTIWYQDEERLLSCFNRDTASKRDRAMFGVLLQSGYRAESVAKIRWDIHVVQVGDPTVVIIPDVKSTLRIHFRLVLRGRYARFLTEWYEHRVLIHRDVPYLFITNSATRVDCNSISEMMRDLSQAAGYGRGFFTAKCFRTSHANRLTADVLSNGGTLKDAADQLRDNCRWSTKSTAVERYIDPNIRVWFSPDGFDLSRGEFRELSPELLHDIDELFPWANRPMSWFSHPEEWIQPLLQHIGVVPNERIFLSRLRIGKHLLYRCSAFRLLYEECLIPKVDGKRPRGTPSDDQILSNLIGCLLEDGGLEAFRWMTEEEAQYLKRCVTVHKLTGPLQKSALRATRVVGHPLQSREQANKLSRALSRRIFDNRTHVGELPGRRGTVVLHGPVFERNTIERRTLRDFQLDRDFPQDAPNNEQQPSSAVVTPPVRATPSTSSTTPHRNC
jgi:integrase